MAISGNLKTFYLSSLLQLLSNDKKTGILELTDGHDIVQVYLREGTIKASIKTAVKIGL